jgi:hypothetical protein
MSWCTYPFGYISGNLGPAGNKATLYEQIGFSLADVVAKAVCDILIGAIASEKYTMEEDDLDLSVRWLWRSLAMIPFCYVVLMLSVGLNEATTKQPPLAATRLVSA